MWLPPSLKTVWRWPSSPSCRVSASKAGSDHLVRAWFHTYGLPVLTTNCSNNYGPNHFPEKLIPLCINNIKHNRPLPIYGKGENVRDWLHVEDHCNGIEKVLLHGKPGETYNIGGEQEWKNIDLVHEIIRQVASLTGLDRVKLETQLVYVKDRPGHDHRYAIDCSKIKRELNWKPSPNFAELLQATIRWYIENPDWVENITSGSYRDWLEKNYVSR